MNGVFTFVLLLVAIVLCAKLVQRYIDNRGTRAEEDEVESTLEKIDALEARIEVLERIVTENRYDLKKKIDSL